MDGPGWAEPDPAIRDLLNRYIALGVRGQLSERPTLAESIAASRPTLGAEVTANGNLLSPATTDRFLSLLGNAEPVVFGVQGTLIGHRNLHAVTFDVRFGNMSLGFA